MATREEIYAAIKNADAAGDSDSVRKLGAYLQTMGAPQGASAADRVANDAITQGAKNFNAGDSFGSNVLTGIGRGMASIGRAVGLGGESKADAERLDAPLMKTGGGKLGNVIGQAAAVAPTALIPGANTALGATLIGAGVGAATTEGGLEDRLAGAAFGAGGGIAGQAVGKGASYLVNGLAQKRAASQLASQTANAGKDAAAVAAQKAGYVLPPTEVNPSILNSMAEGFSGKIKTSQSASAKNQPVTNDLAKAAVGLPANQPITPTALQGVRAQAGQAYDAVAKTGTITPGPAYEQALDAITASAKQAAQGFPNAKANPLIAEIESLKSKSFDAGSAIAKIKSLRADAETAYAGGNKELGKALKSGAGALEDAIDQHLTTIGAPTGMLQGFRDARQLIAKTYTVEKALNPTTGDVSASVLAAQLKKGKPLSGDLRTAAEAGQAFPKATQSLQQNYNALSPWDYAAGIGSAVASGHPLMLAAPLARPAVRAAILSKPVQNRLAASYGPSLPLNALQAITNKGRRILPAAAALPADQ